MLCPGCGYDNLPGADQCAECHTSLTQEDVPNEVVRSRIEKSVTEDRIKTLNPIDAISVAEETTLDAAVQTMHVRKIGCLLITDSDGKLCGILTERDFVTRIAGDVEDLSAHTVSQFMTPRPETVQENQLLASALQSMMVGDFRYLPLVDEEGRPTKLLSSRDIIGYLTGLVETLYATD